jgi:putative oxidoreductase
MLFHKLDRFRDFGLLILRIGIGVAFVFHGYPKLLAGKEMWTGLGQALGAFGFDLPAPLLPVMGFLAALAETGGGALLVLGLLTRPACLGLLATMTVATIMHMDKGDGFKVYSHALEAGILFFSLIFIGPGKFSLDARWAAKRGKAG